MFSFQARFTRIIILFLPLTLTSPSDASTTHQDIPRSKPARELKAALNEALAQSHVTLPRLRSLQVLHRGHLIHRSWHGNGEKNAVHPVHSITKSVLSLLIGIAVSEGKFPDLDSTFGALFPNQRLAAGVDQLTLRNALTMTTGQSWGEFGNEMWLWSFSRSRHLVPLQIPVTGQAGYSFSYMTPLSDLLGVVLTESVGSSLSDYAAEKLFFPLGISNFHWARNGGDYFNAGSGLSLRPSDLAKIGLLMTMHGRWDGVQLVPEKWIRQITAPAVRLSDRIGYGSHWWIRDVAGCASYRAAGRGGQYITVIPEKELAIVLTQKTSGDGRDLGNAQPLFRQITRAAGGECNPGNNYAATQRTMSHMTTDPAAKLPPELKEFFRSFVSAVSTSDLNATMDHYSDAFLLAGKTKNHRRELWKKHGPKMRDLRYTFDSVEKISENLFLVNAWTHFGTNSLPSPVHLVNENGNWRFLGERFGTAPPADLPDDLATFVNGFQESLKSPDFGPIGAHISANYLSNGLTKESLEERWHETAAHRAGIKIQVMEYTPVSDGYRVAGYLVLLDGFKVPMEHLYGQIRRVGETLKWIGNGREKPLVGASPNGAY